MDNDAVVVTTIFKWLDFVEPEDKLFKGQQVGCYYLYNQREFLEYLERKFDIEHIFSRGIRDAGLCEIHFKSKMRALEWKMKYG